MYVDQHGDMNFINHKTKDIGFVNLSEKGWNGKGQYEVNGWIKNSNGVEKYKIKGKWDS